MSIILKVGLDMTSTERTLWIRKCKTYVDDLRIEIRESRHEWVCKFGRARGRNPVELTRTKPTAPSTAPQLLSSTRPSARQFRLPSRPKSVTGCSTSTRRSPDSSRPERRPLVPSREPDLARLDSTVSWWVF